MTAKSILITGCSSGIGYHTAKVLKERGYRVFAGVRKESDVARLKAEGFEAVQLDICDSDSIKKAVDYVAQQTGGTLDALFNNAGIMEAGGVEDLTRDMIRQQFETNVFGPMELIKYVLPIMRKQGHGRILQNSSILGVMTIPYYGAYNASKYALEAFSSTLRQELRGTKIYVTLINPGPITSKLRENAFEIYRNTLQQQKDNRHQETYKKLEENYFNKKSVTPIAKRKSPQLVTDKVIAALESRVPKRHYFVGPTANVMNVLRLILPESVIDWIVSKDK